MENFQLIYTQTATLTNLAYFPALQTTYSGYGGESGTFFPGTSYQFDAIQPKYRIYQLYSFRKPAVRS